MDEEKFYTIPETATRLRVTRAAVYKWMREGKLAFVMVGSERRVTSSAIAAFVKEGHIKPKVDRDKGSGVQSDESRSPSLAAA